MGQGVAKTTGGYGGYSVGTINLTFNDKLYISVGGKGADGAVNVIDSIGGYNGGGLGHWDNNDDEASGGGGGATHIAKSSGLLSDFIDKKNEIIIVSGGGGGGGYVDNGGSGGGFEGNIGIRTNKGISVLSGKQLSGYSFGIGGDGIQLTSTPGGGGGGGYFGGYGGNDDGVSGAGGSGNIANSLLNDKYMYCYNCETSDVESTKTYTTTCAEETPTKNCAKIGNGYARITYLHI